MAQFKFKLQGVLRHRELQEEQRRRELSAVQAERTALENEIRSIHADIENNARDMRDNHLMGNLDLAFLTGHRRFVAGLHRKAGGVTQQLNMLQPKLDNARAVWAEAAKARKIIEKLQERQMERWKQDQDRRETSALDEVGMQMSAIHVADELQDMP